MEVSNTEQTNTVDDAQGRSEADNSGDSELETLLNNFQEQTQPETKPKAKPETRVVQPDFSKLEPVIRFAEAAMEKEKQETFNKDVDAATDVVAAGEEFEGLPKKSIRRMLVGYALEDPAFDKAFENRRNDPNAWDAALKKAQSVLAEDAKAFPKPEQKNDRDDIEAAKAAVAGVSESESKASGPSPADMAKMSDAQWNQFIEEELARAS